MSEDIISKTDYEENDPIYQRIKKEFTNKLKDKYQCEDYESIVKYVFDYVFKKKTPKSQCIKNLNSIFNNKASVMIDYLWKITKEAENAPEESDSEEKNFRKGGKNWKRDNKKRSKEGKFSKGKRDRSRSYSKDRPSSKFDYENYPNYPPMVPKGFYPPKGRFGGPMMPMGGAYPPYMMPPMIKRFKKKFPTKKPVIANKEGTVEENKENKDGAKDEQVKAETQELTEEQKKKMMELEAFNKLTPEEQKEVLAKRVATKKVRCKNWPNCKDPMCIFAHPTETCPYFPSCTYGDKCCYIHPSIPCKFGYYCTRIGCAYSHPQGFNPGMAMYPNMMQSIPFKKHKKNFQPGAQEKPAIGNEKGEEKENEQKMDENDTNPNANAANPSETQQEQKQDQEQVN